MLHCRDIEQEESEGANVPVKNSALTGRVENGGTLGQGAPSGSFYLACNSCAAQDGHV